MTEKKQPTVLTGTAVENMKRAAKAMRKAEGIKHVESLEAVAKAHGYGNWHAVTKAATTLRQRQLSVAIETNAAIERQFKGRAGWHAVTSQEAADALAHGDDAWFRVRPGVVSPMKSGEKSVIVYGPAGSGKTKHAEELRKYFGLDHVRDLEHTHHVRPITGTLYLTSLTPAELVSGGVIDDSARRVYSLAAALAAARGQA